MDRKVILILLSLFWLTGCAPNELTCTRKNVKDDIELTEIITINFNKNKSTQYKSTNIISLIGEENNWDYIVSLLDNTILENDAVKVKKNIDEEKFIYELEVIADLTKIKDKSDNYNVVNFANKTYNEIKTSLEIANFTCK